MKRINIHIFGKIKNTSILTLCGKYVSLSNHYIKTEIKIHKDPGERKICLKDLPLLLAKLIILTEKGKEYDSLAFSKFLFNKINDIDEANFILGNGFGFDENVLSASSSKLALSQLTTTHELALLILLEQIFRGLNIHANGKYHK